MVGGWYQLAAGVFEPTAAPGQPAVAALPWTVQARVSDLAALDGRLYLAVNGHGLASLEPPQTAASAPGTAGPDFRYYYDPILFRYRTLTTLVPAAGSVTCHLYFNSLLNVADAGELPIRGLGLLRLHPQDGIFQQIMMPFQISHPGWECVGFVPVSDQEFLLEWKLAELERTRFEYTRYSLAAFSETPAERLEYRRAWEPQPSERRLPADLQPLARELARRAEGRASAVFIGVRSSADSLQRRYAQGKPVYGREDGGSLLTAHAFRDGERWLLLASDGLLLASPTGGGSGALAERRLPALPAGFQYTGLFVLAGLLVAPWEQVDFILSGAAGIFISGEL